MLYNFKEFLHCRHGDDPQLSDDEIWRAKYIYDSSYHPDTGEKQNVFGRMSASVPCNMILIGCILAYQKYVH